MDEITTITQKGQVTIPKKFRDKFNWHAGTKLRFFMDEEQLKVKEVTIQDEFEDIIMSDLIKQGYQGKDLTLKLMETKAVFDEAFEKMLLEREEEGTVSLEDALRSIDRDDD